MSDLRRAGSGKVDPNTKLHNSHPWAFPKESFLRWHSLIQQHCLHEADPTKRPGLLQTMMGTWILFGVVFILDWEAKQRESIHFHERREKESIPLCHSPNTTNHPNWSTGLVAPQVGRESLLQRVQHTTNVCNICPRVTHPQTVVRSCLCICAHTSVPGRQWKGWYRVTWEKPTALKEEQLLMGTRINTPTWHKRLFKGVVTLSTRQIRLYHWYWIVLEWMAVNFRVHLSLKVINQTV